MLCLLFQCNQQRKIGRLREMMASQSGMQPSLLRQQVTSPNGTTAAALRVLMADPGLAGLLRRAVAAAFERAQELRKN